MNTNNHIISEQTLSSNATSSHPKSFASQASFPGKTIYDDVNLVKYSGNHLPHWETTSVIYHVSFRLADSVPECLIRQWNYERNRLLNIARSESRILSNEEVRRLQFLYSDRIERYLDAGYGSCILREEIAAKIVKESLEFFNHQKYMLHSWCIMPNHVHTVFEMLGGTLQREVLRSWKSYTAHAINKVLGRSGQLWQRDSYNHIIRSEKEYYNQMWYVWNNPQCLPAEISKWRWSILQQEAQV